MVEFKILSAINNTNPFEIIVASVIIVLTVIVLIILYRNVSRELQEWKQQKDIMNGKIEEKEEANEESLSEMENLLESIDKRINNANEGDLAVFFTINIDDFHYITEKYDQKLIDKVITEIEKRLKKHAKKSDVSGHLKSDSFIFYHVGEVNNDIINNLGNELLEIIKEPLKTVEEELTASIGIVIFPYDGSNADHLLKNGELALYVAKKEGKNRTHLYSEDLIEKEQFNISYYQEIKRSIENDEFLLYYQPIVDLKTGSIIGFESLLRWNHPTMGILPPGKFLNVMDLSGDITWFGTWGFEKIVKQYKYWRERVKFRDIFISTNLSPKQLAIEGLAHQFYNITKKLEMSSELFCLEIVDYYNTVKNPIAVHNLNEFRKFGFRIAVDDMGSNYEIINDLQDIQAGIFKVSRENLLLVMDEADNSDKIHRAIETAKKLQKVVIVEGLETPEMIEKAVSWDVRFMQGYFFSEPIDTDKAEDMLKHSPWNMASFNNFFNKPE